MQVLVSNDDGVFAPGIRVLANELSEIARVFVMAPDRNQSGASSSLTLSRPLSVFHLESGYLSIDGTPSDCVHLGLTGYLDAHIDMVVSGINEGANLGDDVLYSGTVAAAIEGRFLGFPAIAISLVADDAPKLYFETAAKVARQLVLKLIKHPLPAQTILNVNVPNLPISQIKGLVVTRLGSREASEALLEQTCPRGRSVYWIGKPGIELDGGPGTDFFAIKEGYVSVTPLHFDMTHYKIFEQVASWTEDIACQF